METVQPHPDVSTKSTGSAGRTALGLVLLLPALLCCISQLLVPTVNTLLVSFQEINLFGSEKEWVGLENYASLSGNENFWRAAGFTLATLAVRLFALAIVPLLLAWAASQFRRPLRLGLRILFTLPVVFFVPVAIAITWLMVLNPVNGLFSFERSWLASPASARSLLLFIDALYLSGLASGLGLLVFMPLWRRPADTPPPTFREVWKPMLATWAVGMLAVSALTLSTFTLSSVLTNGGPAGSTNTLGTLFYQLAFRNFDMGPAASIASLILLITLLLGIVAGMIVILSRLRLDFVSREPKLEETDPAVNTKRSQPLAAALFVLLTLGVCTFGALPFGWLLPQAFGGEGPGTLLEQISPGQVFINSLVPPLVTATLQVLTAYLAALSIGALQPLGKRSGWLLLLFSPWLFIHVLPLSLVKVLAAQQAGMLDSFWGSLSPILLSVPALFILTIFFAARGSHMPRETQAGEAQSAPGFFEQFILPSLPLAGVLWLLLVFSNGQDVFWPLLVSASPERYTFHITLLQLLRTFGGTQDLLAAAITFFILPVSVFFFLCLVPFQLGYLDRLRLYSEAPRDPDQR